MAAGFDGFLRRAYNSWVKDVLIYSRFRTCPAGDIYILVYPGPRSSIRFERLKEGIQDAEKIRILRNEFQVEKTPEALAKLDQLDITFTRFDLVEKPDDLAGMLVKGKQVLGELSR